MYASTNVCTYLPTYLSTQKKYYANPSQTHVKKKKIVNKYVIRNYYCYVDFIVKKAKPCHFMSHLYRNIEIW